MERVSKNVLRKPSAKERREVWKSSLGPWRVDEGKKGRFQEEYRKGFFNNLLEERTGWPVFRIGIPGLGKGRNGEPFGGLEVIQHESLQTGLL